MNDLPSLVCTREYVLFGELSVSECHFRRQSPQRKRGFVYEGNPTSFNSPPHYVTPHLVVEGSDLLHLRPWVRRIVAR
jgi:hypothetical protein